MSQKEPYYGNIDISLLHSSHGKPNAETAKAVYALGDRIYVSPQLKAQLRGALAVEFNLPPTLSFGESSKQLDKDIQSCLYLEKFSIDARKASIDYQKNYRALQKIWGYSANKLAPNIFSFSHFVTAVRNTAIKIHTNTRLVTLEEDFVTNSRSIDPPKSSFYLPAVEHDDRVNELYEITEVCKKLPTAPDLPYVSEQKYPEFMRDMWRFRTTRSLYENSMLILPPLHTPFELGDVLHPFAKLLKTK